MMPMPRREAIALPAMLALHGLAAPSQAMAAVATADADRELLALCRRYLSMDRRSNRLATVMIRANREGDEETGERTYDAITRFVPYQQDLLFELMELRATTPAGIRAKAEVMATHILYSTANTPLDEQFPLWSLCRDLLGYAPVEGGAT